ncbi:MAG: RluA family pseudouridine synthase [Candidatus Binatia bacterium]
MAGDAGSRLDAFLRAQLPFLSRRELDDALREGCFTINGRLVLKGYRLAEGDVVCFAGPAARFFNAPIANRQLRVPLVYEDASLLALNKPAGMDCHGFSGRYDQTVANFLVARWPELVNVGKSRWEPGLVHRLDRATSGLVLVAKNQAVFNELRRQFSRRAVKKTYLALVQGSIAEEGTIAFPLTHDSNDRRKMRAVIAPRKSAWKHKIWPAVTHYRKLAEQKGMSFLRLEMETGVTHQLRVHLALIGHSIVGDSLYGTDVQEVFSLGRHFLHASGLRFMHPVSGHAVRLNVALPDELSAILSQLNMQLSFDR